MMKRRFTTITTILAGALAGNTAFFATQAIATQETNMQPVDQYWIIDLEAIEWETPEFSSASETSESEEETDVSEPAQATYLNETGLFESENQQDMIYAQDYAVKGVRMDEAIISYLLDGCEAYADYGAIDICEVTYLQPADENGLFKLFLQKEDGASVIHYSLDAEGLLQKSIENTDFVSADGCDSKTNHWLIVHLTPEVSSAAVENQEETDEAASQSLEGKVDEDTSETTSQDVAKADPTKPSKPSEKSSSESATKPTKPTTKAPETTKPASTKPAQTTKAPETAATVAPTAATTAPPTTSPAPTTTQTPTVTTTAAAQTTAPTTTAHTHNWVAVTKIVHHDAVTNQVWKEDSAAWDETVVTKAAWDEQVLVQEAYDEQVLVSEAYDEPVYGWVDVCNACGHHFWTADDDVDVHMHQGCWSSWHAEWLQIGSTHHEAVYSTVHHDAVYTTVHHDAETTVVHHEATGHYETVVTQAAWDETVTTGYKCSGCGAKK